MQIRIFGIPVTSLSLTELLPTYREGLLIFHNLDTVNKSRHSARFRSVCEEADLCVIDGQILRFLVMLLWGRSAQKVSGSDFLPAFCRFHAADPDVNLFLLGAGPGVAKQAGASLNAKAGRDLVVGVHSPSFQLLDDEEESARVIDMINASGADTLAVGLGAPKQELWMAKHRDQMPGVRRLVAVGATLDFEAERVRRAPAWVSVIGMEWAFRLVSEPRRLWRRYLVEGPQTAVAMARVRVLDATGRGSETSGLRSAA